MSVIQLWQKFWRNSNLSKELISARDRIQEPILNRHEIIALAEELDGLAARLPANPKQSDALRQGEQPSRFMGAGMEYEESRPYELGDEIRRINWRLMARTGQAYTKLFQEERQENWFILVDHRSSMRFGTRTRLKATQAARVAGYLAWQAQQQGIPVAAGRLAQNLVQTPIFEGRSSYAQIMAAVSQPCPPLAADEQSKEPRINDVLLKLNQQLPAGSRLLLISDFMDVDEKTTEILIAMQERVMVKAVLITDSSELELPDIDGLSLQSSKTGDIYSLQSKSQQASFKRAAQTHFDKLQSHFQHASIAPNCLLAHADLQELNQVLSQPGHASGETSANYKTVGAVHG